MALYEWWADFRRASAIFACLMLPVAHNPAVRAAVFSSTCLLLLLLQTMFHAKPGLVWRLGSEHATITAAQLQHRVPCWGYVFDELTPQQQQQQQEKEQQQQQGRRVLILGDTVDSRAIAPVACGADLVSHEATFASGMEGKAAVAQHSTAWMAGQFAWAIEARSLVLTHFSARYEGSSAAVAAAAPQQGGRGGRGGQQDRRVRAWEVAQAKAEAAAADERAVKALQREAEEFYSQGPILLAADLFTAHVPVRQSQGDSR
jgi:ribonuclease Z